MKRFYRGAEVPGWTETNPYWDQRFVDEDVIKFVTGLHAIIAQEDGRPFRGGVCLTLFVIRNGAPCKPVMTLSQ